MRGTSGGITLADIDRMLWGELVAHYGTALALARYR